MAYPPFLPKIKLKKFKIPGFLKDIFGNKYTGPAIQDHLGNFFKGKKLDENSEPLIFVPDKKEEDSSKEIFNRYTSPNDKDYQKGKMKRYFVKDIPSNKVSELDKDSYLKQQKENKPYRKFLSIDWLVSGLIDDTTIAGYSAEGIKSKNQKALDDAESLLPGLKNVVTDAGQFAQNLTEEDRLGANSIENLSTKPNQFVIEGTGVPYNGPYHIHPTLGPMIGARHTPAKHPRLTFIGTVDQLPKELSNQQKYAENKSTVSQNREYSGYTLIRSE